MKGIDFMENILITTNSTPIEVLLKMDKEGRVTARNLYAFLELEKSNYSKWCRVNILENIFAEEGIDYTSFVPVDERKFNPNPTTDYYLKVEFAKKLAMQSKTERGERARCYFIACEEALKKVVTERQKWEIERAKGVVIRHVLTDTIKMKVADSPNKKFMYPNYTKMIYKFIFGKTMNDLREQYGVKGKESIREYITADELKEVESLEMLISSLINLGMGYDEIKSFINSKATALLAG